MSFAARLVIDNARAVRREVRILVSGSVSRRAAVNITPFGGNVLCRLNNLTIKRNAKVVAVDCDICIVECRRFKFKFRRVAVRDYDIIAECRRRTQAADFKRFGGRRRVICQRRFRKVAPRLISRRGVCSRLKFSRIRNRLNFVAREIVRISPADICRFFIQRYCLFGVEVQRRVRDVDCVSVAALGDFKARSRINAAYAEQLCRLRRRNIFAVRVVARCAHVFGLIC